MRLSRSTGHAERERRGYTDCMKSVSYALRPPGHSLRALAGLVALVAQFVAAVLAPAADAHAGASAPQHVEVAGTHLHYSHNPTDCASCAAQQLIGVIEFSPGAPRAPPSPSR